MRSDDVRYIYLKILKPRRGALYVESAYSDDEFEIYVYKRFGWIFTVLVVQEMAKWISSFDLKLSRCTEQVVYAVAWLLGDYKEDIRCGAVRW